MFEVAILDLSNIVCVPNKTKYFISLPYYIYIYIYINIIKFYIVHSLYIDYIHCIFEHIYIYINIYINIVTSWRQSNAQLRLAQYSQVRLARLFPSDTGTIVSKWYWHNFSQVTLAQLFTSKTGTIIPKWDWPNCSQVTLTRLFASETGTIVPTWDQQGCSEVNWHHCSQVNFDFLFCILFCSFFFGTILH